MYIRFCVNHACVRVWVYVLSSCFMVWVNGLCGDPTSPQSANAFISLAPIVSF